MAMGHSGTRYPESTSSAIQVSSASRDPQSRQQYQEQCPLRTECEINQADPRKHKVSCLSLVRDQVVVARRELLPRSGNREMGISASFPTTSTSKSPNSCIDQVKLMQSAINRKTGDYALRPATIM